MAPMKRKATFMKRAAKRSRANSDVPTVVNVLAHADALPENLRSVLKATLPIVLDANKADRHAFEAEVVNQAQQALGAVQAAMEQAHATAVAEQNKTIAPAERAQRVAAQKAAEAHLEALKHRGEADKAARKVADKAVEDAEDALKVAQKEEKAAEKELQRHVDRHANASGVLATEYILLSDNSVGTPAEVRKAMQKVVALGKEHHLDSTLLSTLPITCKKHVDHWTEFESMMFANLKGLLENVIVGLSQVVAGAEPVRDAKVAAAASAKATLESARATLKAAEDELAATHQSQRDANKQVHQADAHRRKLWNDMRHVCDAADSLNGDLKNMKEHIWAVFQKLKEKEPEPEPVQEPEPIEEAAPEAAPEAEVPAEA